MFRPQLLEIGSQGGLFLGIQSGERFMGRSVVGTEELYDLRRREGIAKRVDTPAEFKLKSKLFSTIARLSVASILLAGVVAIAFAVPAPQPAYADNLTPPAVPANIQVPAGNKLFLVGHAVGTQNYICVPAGTGVRFVLFTPEATLFDDEGGQLTTHYFSPNPSEVNTDPKVISNHPVRAAWQDSKDSSTVWGQVKPGHSSSDPSYVEPGAIPWLLVTIVGRQDGPAGGDRLSGTTFIQRLNTHGGAAPSTGCSSPEDLGSMAFVPYTTEYYFYKSTGGGS